MKPFRHKFSRGRLRAGPISISMGTTSGVWTRLYRRARRASSSGCSTRGACLCPRAQDASRGRHVCGSGVGCAHVAVFTTALAACCGFDCVTSIFCICNCICIECVGVGMCVCIEEREAAVGLRDAAPAFFLTDACGNARRWSGEASFQGSISAYVSSVKVTPLNEPRDADYPQVGMRFVLSLARLTPCGFACRSTISRRGTHRGSRRQFLPCLEGVPVFV